jgi:hypothetical protein
VENFKGQLRGCFSTYDFTFKQIRYLFDLLQMQRFVSGSGRQDIEKAASTHYKGGSLEI